MAAAIRPVLRWHQHEYANQGVEVGVAYDYVAVYPVNGVAALTAAYANAVSLYTTFQVTEKFSVSGRGEYFTQSHSNGGVGLPAKVIAFTATAQYDLWKNVLSRLELRWDHQADGTGKAYGGTVAAAPGTRRNAYEVIANIAYKF